MHIHLMEPYRSAFVSRCISESLIAVKANGYGQVGDISDAVTTCGTPELIADALQLAVLAEDLSMVWTKAGSKALEQGLPHMEASGIENLDVIKLVDKYPEEVENEIRSRLQDVRSLNDYWKTEISEIDSFAPLILSQTKARGKPLHWSLFRLLRACRLENYRAVPLIMTVVPPELRSVASTIQAIEPRGMHPLEYPLLSTYQELRLTAATAELESAKIAGASPIVTGCEVGEASSELWGLVVEQLAGEGIEFPVPQSIVDVVKLRAKPEIIDFRSFLMAFLDAVLQGNEEGAEDLRRGIRSCLKAFRRYPLTKRLASWTSYASFAAGVVGGLHPVLTASSIGGAVVSYGCSALADKWRQQSSWLWLST